MIPGAVFEKVAEEWLAEFDNMEQASRFLATASSLSMDAWRRRLTAFDERSWFTRELEPERVDEFLIAAGMPHLWFREPLNEFLSPLAAAEDDGEPLRNSGAKRSYMPRKLDEERVRAAHVLHMKGDMSINEISKLKWEEWGFSNPNALCSDLCRAFAVLGLSSRGRIEMTVLKSTKNGLSPRNHRLRRQRRVEAGFTAQLKVRQAPCASYGCGRSSMKTSDFCCAHDPDRKESSEETLVRMRATARKNLVDGSYVIWLVGHARAQVGTWRELGALCDTNPEVLQRISVYPPGKLMKPRTIERIVAGLGQLEQRQAA